MMDPTRNRVRVESNSNNFRKYSKFYAVICLITILTISNVANSITAVGAEEDNFSKTSPVYKASKSCKDAQNCVEDNSSNSVKTPKDQQDSLTTFINWLFGPPASASSSKPELGDKTSSIVSSNRRNDSVPSSSFESKDQLGRPEVEEKNESVHNESASTRLKRDYKPVKVPYTDKNKDSVNSSELRRRQLLINPWDQQQQQAMQVQAMQQQQQQAAAAAAMLQLQQQQQQQMMLNGNRNRYPGYLDDYDDDDSDEDSDEFDDFSQFGMYNGGPPFVHFQRKMGLGRRSVPEGDKKQKKWNGRRPSQNEGGEETENRRISNNNNKFSLRNGDWFLDDYDLNSAFYDRPQERRHLPDHLLDEDRKEMDEEHLEDDNDKAAASDYAKKEEAEADHLKHRGDLDYIYREFKDSLCKDNECLEVRQATGSSTTGSTTGGTTMAGSTSGGSTMGGSTSGGSTMAATTSGGSTMGGSTSGGSTMGGSTSGGSTMGGSTMGGSTSGSSTMGGSTSGSSTTGGSTSGSSTTGGSTSGSSTTGGSTSGSSTTGGSTSGSSTTGGGGTGSGSTTKKPKTTTKKPKTTTKPRPPPPYKATLNCRCGTQSVRGDLVGGGTVIRYNVNPWLVAISSGTKHLCSGSLITDRDILTSKSCTKNSGGNITVIAGMTSRKPTNYSVTKITTNPKFNLAILRLSKPIKPGHTMRPVCLPIGQRSSGDYSTGTLVTFKKGPPPKNNTLQMVDTEVALMSASSSSKCNSTAAGSICAGPPGSIKCGGDTGGLLQVYRGGYSYEQIGVVAGTVGCRSSSSPGVYTDIRKRARWILNNAKGGNFCKNPKISASDLSSTIRLGDPAYSLNNDDDDNANEVEEESPEDDDNVRLGAVLHEDEEDEDQGAEIFDDGEETRDDFS